MIKKYLGKITRVKFGHVGYQEGMFGLELDFRFESGEIGTHIGNWDTEIIKWSEYCKWSEADRTTWHDNLCRKLSKLLKQAKIDDVYKLKDIPVELTIEDNWLKDWRILEEVL